MRENDPKTMLLVLGKKQVDALFKMQMDDSVEMLDDSCRWWR